MELEMYVIVLLFAVAVVGFIAAINSHGVARSVLSYVLATLVLVSGVITLVSYNSDKVMKEVAKKEAVLAEKARQDELLRQQKAEEDARAAAALAAQAAAGGTQDAGFTQQLSTLANKGLDITRAILAVNVDAEMADEVYEAVVKRAAGYKAGAVGVKKQLESAWASAPQGQDIAAVRELLDKAARELSAGAVSFALYFKAEDENQENERYDAYQQNIKAAKADFNKALEKLSGK
ncbi:MAG: hypothetical protein V1913_00225 [Fibrobacterota bacterium]